ncbi:MAG: flagellar hook-associated protein FlgL [Firmicutes bacterium]|jgi:flagellar hook-associated protein 3 FlgL|nr:flagellar hook-associated protein FlgL [Bacillota bacterium]
MRVTNNVMIERSIRYINTTFQRLQACQERVATGKSITRLSDDPHGAAKAVRIRSTLRGIEQYRRNVDDLTTELTANDDTLAKVGDVLNRVRELILRGATDTATPIEREAIAVEVTELFWEVVQAGNSVHNGRYQFAGHKVSSPPFEVVGNPPETVVYRGDSGRNVIEIGPGVTVASNLTGEEVFIGDVSVYDTLIEVANHLRSDDVETLATADLANIDSVLDRVLKLRSELGGRTNRAELIANRLQDDTISLTSLLSKTEDVDLAEAVLRLAEQENAYHAALTAAARSAQTGLINYLK